MIAPYFDTLVTDYFSECPDEDFIINLHATKNDHP